MGESFKPSELLGSLTAEIAKGIFATCVCLGSYSFVLAKTLANGAYRFGCFVTSLLVETKRTNTRLAQNSVAYRMKEKVS